jgi:hypothetical protein
MISCEKTKSLMVPFLENELGSTESELILEHLEVCQTCADLASDLSSFEIEQPESYNLSLTQEQQDLLDEELLQLVGVESISQDMMNIQDSQDEHVLSFPSSNQPLKQETVRSKPDHDGWVSKERVLVAALLICFFWGAYQSYQVEKLHSVIQDQQQSLQIQQQSIKRMETVMQVRPSSPDPYIMTVSHVPRRMDL